MTQTSSAITQVLQQVELFQGLTEAQLEQIANLCRMGRAKKGHIVFREESEGDELYIVYEGSVEIQVLTRNSDGEARLSTITTIYPRQTFGEMAIMDEAVRSATAIASATPTTLIILPGTAFKQLCEADTAIGYRVTRNLVRDLIYKLRSSSILLRGNIKWKDGQLSQLPPSTTDT